VKVGLSFGGSIARAGLGVNGVDLRYLLGNTEGVWDKGSKAVST